MSAGIISGVSAAFPAVVSHNGIQIGLYGMAGFALQDFVHANVGTDVLVDAGFDEGGGAAEPPRP